METLFFSGPIVKDRCYFFVKPIELFILLEAHFDTLYMNLVI